MFSINTSLFIVLYTQRLLEKGFNFQSLVSKQKFPNNILRQPPKDLIFATKLDALHNLSINTMLNQILYNYLKYIPPNIKLLTN